MAARTDPPRRPRAGRADRGGCREHCRLKGGAALTRPHVEALVADGEIRRVAVDDGGPDVLVPADAELDGAPSGSVLLSPFDNLLWDRAFTERLFGFRHVIEVYKRGHEREYGYYVLPLLLGDRLVGRADLKSDRAEGVLRGQRVPPRAGRAGLGAPRRRARPRARPARAHDRARAGRAIARTRTGRVVTLSARRPSGGGAAPALRSTRAGGRVGTRGMTRATA